MVAAVSGLGGIGKSTFAARYARLHSGRFHPAWWITADTFTALQPQESEDADLEALVERATAWLAAMRGGC